MRENALSTALASKTLHFQWKERPIRNPGVKHLHRLERRGIVNPFVYNLSDEKLNLPEFFNHNRETSFLFVYTDRHEVILGVENPFCASFFDHCNPHLQQYLSNALNHLIVELIEEELANMHDTSPTKGHLRKIFTDFAPHTEQNRAEIKSLIRQVVQLKPVLSSSNPHLVKLFSDKACRVALLHALTMGHPSIIISNEPDMKPARLGGELYYNKESGEWILENRSGRYSRELSGDFFIDHYANTHYLLAVAKKLKMLGVGPIRCNLFVKDKVRSQQGKIPNPDKEKLAFLNRCIESYLNADFQFLPMLAQSLHFKKANDSIEQDRELSHYNVPDLIRTLATHFPMESGVLEAFLEIHIDLSTESNHQSKLSRYLLSN